MISPLQYTCSPFSPLTPSLPFSPFSPSFPNGPWSPGIPGGPSGPPTPGLPDCPWGPASPWIWSIDNLFNISFLHVFRVHQVVQSIRVVLSVRAGTLDNLSLVWFVVQWVQPVRPLLPLFPGFLVVRRCRTDPVDREDRRGTGIHPHSLNERYHSIVRPSERACEMKRVNCTYCTRGKIGVEVERETCEWMRRTSTLPSSSYQRIMEYEDSVLRFTRTST